MSSQKTKVLYICGVGHSGSTIVDMVLGMCPDLCSAAQVNELFITYDPFAVQYPERSWRDDFWCRIVEGFSKEEQCELTALHRGVLKEKTLLRMFFSRANRRRTSRLNEGLFNRIADEIGAPVVIDSSKNIARCLSMSDMDTVDLYVLHLIRDVRGFVNSTNKRKREKGRSCRWAIPTMLWFAKNTAASLLVSKHADRFMTLKYEDIVASPDEAVMRIETWLGTDLSVARDAFRGRIDIDPEHSIGFGGNRVLHQRKRLQFRTGERETDGVYLAPAFWFTLGWVSRFWGYRRIRDTPST